MSCKGLHCPGCGDGGGGLAVVLIVLAVIAAAAWHVRRGIETGLEIVMWSIVGTAGLVVASGLVYAGLRWRASVRNHRESLNQEKVVPPDRAIPVRAEVVRLSDLPVRKLPPRGEHLTPGSDSQAIEAPRPRAASWPLPGQWEEIRDRIGRDG